MVTKLCLTTMQDVLPGCFLASLSFVCADCTSQASVMIERAKDGTVLSSFVKRLNPPFWWRYNRALGATEDVKVSILCGFCGHANGECLITKQDAGISSISVNLSDCAPKNAPLCAIGQ